MPIIQSAKKRVRVAAKQRVQNLRTKRTLRDNTKVFYTAVENKKDSTAAQSELFSAIDTAVKKGVMTKNKAARMKSQVNAAAKAAGTTKVGQKATSAAPKKAAAKPKATAKPAAKKAPAKKPAAKKPAAKKAPAKKAAAKK